MLCDIIDSEHGKTNVGSYQQYHHGFGHRVPYHREHPTPTVRRKRDLGPANSRVLNYYRRLQLFSILLFWGLLCVFFAVAHFVCHHPVFYGETYHLDAGVAQIVSIDDVFCSDLELENSIMTRGAAIFSLSRPPSLDGFINTTASKSNSEGNYTYWSGFLFRGSVVSVTVACDNVPGPWEVAFIRGEEKYYSWLYSASGTVEYFYHFETFSNVCLEDEKFSISINTDVDENWFIVIPGRTSDDGMVRFIVNLYRKVYTFEETDVINHCQAYGQNNCLIPTTRGAIYLVNTADNPDSDDDQAVDVKVYCVFQKWVYMKFGVSVSLPLVLAIVVMVGMCYCRLKISNLTQRVVTVSGDGPKVRQSTMKSSLFYQDAPPPYTPPLAQHPAYTTLPAKR